MLLETEHQALCPKAEGHSQAVISQVGRTCVWGVVHRPHLRGHGLYLKLVSVRLFAHKSEEKSSLVNTGFNYSYLLWTKSLVLRPDRSRTSTSGSLR